MTKIFATTQPDSVEKSPHDQKPAKTEGEVYSVIKPTILPISLPNTTIVKKDRKCHFSWIIGLILMLWVLATTVIIFHLAPDCVYRKLHQLTHHSEPHVTMAERFVFDIAEPHIKIAPKLPQISESSNVIDSSASESLNKMMNIDGNKGEQQLMSRAIVDGDVSEPLRKLEAVDGSANEAFRNQAIIDGDVSEPFGIQAIVDGDVGESFKNHASIDGDASEPFKQQLIIDGEANEPFRQQLIVEGETSEPFRNDVIVDGTVEETSKQEVPAEESTGEQRSGNDTIPDDDDATNAIRTLLRRPDVQQVVIVGRSEDSQGERPVKGVIVIDGSAIREGGANPSDVVNHIQNNRGVVIPAEQLMGDSEQPINPVQLAVQPPETLDAIKEQNMALNRPVAPPQMSPAASPDYQQQMIKYHHALIQWQMQREMYRRQLLMRMHRERSLVNENEMPSFMMGPPSPPYRRNTMMIYRMPMPTYHIMFPPPQQPTPEAIAELPSSENNTPRDDKKVPRRLDRQFPVQMESQRQPMIPQQEVAEQLDESHEAETPELPMVRPHDASADQIFAAMQADPKVDRDAIFRRLLAQSQVENSRQEQQEEATESNDQSNPEIHNEIWKMQQTAQDMDQQQETNGDDALQKQERTRDEIFRIFQQQSLQLQREADARESAESTQLKQEVEQITTETSSTEMPKIMIADSFPRRSTVAEPEERPSSTSIPFKESTSNESVSSTPRPDPLAAFFRFFENEALKLNSEIRPAIQDIAALSLQATTQTPEGAIDLDEVSGMELDQPEPAEGTSPVGVETPAPQSTATQDTPLIPSTDESIMLEANDEQALLNSWSKDQDPVLELPERPIVRVVQ